MRLSFITAHGELTKLPPRDKLFLYANAMKKRVSRVIFYREVPEAERDEDKTVEDGF